MFPYNEVKDLLGTSSISDSSNLSGPVNSSPWSARRRGCFGDFCLVHFRDFFLDFSTSRGLVLVVCRVPFDTLLAFNSRRATFRASALGTRRSVRLFLTGWCCWSVPVGVSLSPSHPWPPSLDSSSLRRLFALEEAEGG